MSVRAFLPEGSASPSPGLELELDDEESRYLIKVRRVRPGQGFELLDGAGGVWTARLLTTGRRARVQVDGPAPRRDPGPERILLLGLPDSAATLEALTGASELGATQVVLLRCERSQGHSPPSARIDRVLRAAMRQCGRPAPPELLGAPPESPWTLAAGLGHRSELPGVFGDPLGPRPETHEPGPPRVPASEQGLRLLVGPEGGLTQAEAAAARAAGFVGTHLGPWILRTPTAALALLAWSRSR